MFADIDLVAIFFWFSAGMAAGCCLFICNEIIANRKHRKEPPG
jgi:hypothetical protein